MTMLALALANEAVLYLIFRGSDCLIFRQIKKCRRKIKTKKSKKVDEDLKEFKTIKAKKANYI